MGMLPNKIDERDFLYATMSMHGGKEHPSVEDYSVVADQGSTNSCVGNAVAGGIYIKERQSGYDYKYPSRRALYWNARFRHQGINVTDGGTYIRECFKALQKVGVPDEDMCKFSRKAINDRLEFGIYNYSEPRKGGTYRHIKSTGDDRMNDIRLALSEGNPVVFGTALNSDFMNARGSNLIERPARNDRLVGRHALLMIGYETMAGNPIVRVLNSWGTSWRDDGKCWFSADYIKWNNTVDLTVCDGWERIS
jgi:hypothetical protein